MFPFIEIVEDKNIKLINDALEVLMVLYDIVKSR